MNQEHIRCCVVMIITLTVHKRQKKSPPKRKRIKPLCREENCTKGAVNGYDRCSKHGGGPRCTEQDCHTGAIHGYGRCSTHGGGPRCTEQDCPNGARHGYERCGTHGGGPRCTEVDCPNGAVHGYDRCSKHGGGPTCAMCNKTNPIYNEPHLKRGLYCRQHKLVGMENVVSLRCKHDTCRTFVINTIKHKYRGYCFHHFIQEFPDVPIARNYKTKELAMSRDISERFPNLIWLDDKRIPGGTSGKRGDKMTDLKTHYIIVECDETQHSSYAKELERMLQLSNDVNQIPIIFIRFNPDAYVDNGKKVRSCWGKTDEGVVKITRQKEWNVRLDCLGREIKSAIRNIPTTPISERYLFYNSKFDESMLCEPCNEY